MTCPVCELPLDDTRPWQPGLDGGGVHCDCLPPNPDEEEPDD